VAIVGERGNVYMELVAYTERMKQLGRPRPRCEDILIKF
jgi:hypothetical protein